MTVAANEIADLSPAAIELLKAAERLLAEKGLGAVSTREIAREAGQKNHSALNYHFGSRAALIEAILDYRMTPLNQSRRQLLQSMREQGRGQDLRSLIAVIVQPFADQLLLPVEDSYYLRLLSQLMSHGEWQSRFTQSDHRASAVLEAGQVLVTLLSPVMGEGIAIERVRLLGLHVMNTVTEWDAMGRRGELVLDAEALTWRVQNFINYLLGALTAPHQS